MMGSQRRLTRKHIATIVLIPMVTCGILAYSWHVLNRWMLWIKDERWEVRWNDAAYETTRSLARDVYNCCGLEPRSRKALEATAFYPFTQSLSPTEHGGIISIEVKKNLSGKKVGYSQLSDFYASGHWFSGHQDQWLLSKDLRKLTLKRMHAYLSGYSWHMGILDHIREHPLSLFYKQAGVADYSLKTVPVRPCRGDLPTTNEELKSYNHWLALIYGIDKPQDAWGQIVKFTLVKEKIVCRSAGADGKSGTVDDVVLSKNLPEAR